MEIKNLNVDATISSLEKDKIYFLKITVPPEISQNGLEIYKEKMLLWINQIFLDYGVTLIPFINDERIKVEFLPKE